MHSRSSSIEEGLGRDGRPKDRFYLCTRVLIRRPGLDFAMMYIVIHGHRWLTASWIKNSLYVVRNYSSLYLAMLSIDRSQTLSNISYAPRIDNYSLDRNVRRTRLT